MWVGFSVTFWCLELRILTQTLVRFVLALRLLDFDILSKRWSPSPCIRITFCGWLRLGTAAIEGRKESVLCRVSLGFATKWVSNKRHSFSKLDGFGMYWVELPNLWIYWYPNFHPVGCAICTRTLS